MIPELEVGEVIRAVVGQALRDRKVRRVALLDDGSPEVALAVRFLAPMGDGALLRVSASPEEVDPLLQFFDDATRTRVAREWIRLKVRCTPDALAAAAENRTALLLGGELPPEPLLPLGDLWASEVAELVGGWSASPEVVRVAEAAGGIEKLDAALRVLLDRRDPAGLDSLPPETAREVRRLLAGGCISRIFPRLVPKLGNRTLGVDLFE